MEVRYLDCDKLKTSAAEIW
uniref:Uncharacterized protein n=1 Tax=Rhizophora mucronata TaxID=61149 RepID=A0A2P2NNU2_RHIMU